MAGAEACQTHGHDARRAAEPSPTLDAIVGALCRKTLVRIDSHGVTGASVSHCVGQELAGLIFASDPTAERLDRLQTTFLDSPAHVALRTRGPVMISNLRGEPEDSWLGFGSEAEGINVSSVYVVPLHIGVVVMGILTLHGTGSITPDAALTRDVLQLADVLLLALLTPLGSHQDTHGWEDAVLSEAHIVTHQAAGMVMVQARGTLGDALILLLAAAFSSGSSVREVARRVVARDLSFTDREASRSKGLET